MEKGRVNKISRDMINKKLDVNYKFQNKNEFLMFFYTSWMVIRDNFENIEKAKVKFTQVTNSFNIKSLSAEKIEDHFEKYCSHAFGDGDIEKMTRCMAFFVHIFFKDSQKDFLKFFRVYNNTGVAYNSYDDLQEKINEIIEK